MMLPLDPSALLVVVKDEICLLETIIIIVLSQDKKHPNNVAVEHA
jgi:hypothetical protein